MNSKIDAATAAATTQADPAAAGMSAVSGNRRAEAVNEPGNGRQPQGVDLDQADGGDPYNTADTWTLKQIRARIS